MDFEIGRAGTAEAATGGSHAALRKLGKSVLGAAAIAGLIAVTALPASAEEAPAPADTQEVAETVLPSLGRHIRRAARLPFNVSLKFDDKDTAAKARRPSLARFVRARGHGSEATTVDGYGPDRLVESLTFPSDGPNSKPTGTAMADVKDNTEALAPGL
ncbi:MAG: hypothetical protein ACLFWF_02200 [Alphaproteobacteria bacterium]